MRTKVATLIVTAILSVLFAVPASANGVHPCPSAVKRCTPPPPLHTVTPIPPRPDGLVGMRLCVTTTWRHLHTHQPYTKKGEVCTFTKDMWLPKSYKVLGVFPDGKTLIVQRPR